MKINAKDLTVLESGWYQTGHRIEDMKYDEDDFPHFTVEDIFEKVEEGESDEDGGVGPFSGEVAKFNRIIFE